MTLRLVDSAWGAVLTTALRADTKSLRIICPFIKAGALDRLLALRPKSVQVIARFDLADFADGVSDIGSLRSAVITSANLMGSALNGLDRPRLP